MKKKIVFGIIGVTMMILALSNVSRADGGCSIRACGGGPDKCCYSYTDHAMYYMKATAPL